MSTTVRKRLHTLVLAAMTLVFAGASAPLYAVIEDDPPVRKKIVSTTSFADKSCSGNECTAEGEGCAILVFDDGSVRCLD